MKHASCKRGEREICFNTEYEDVRSENTSSGHDLLTDGEVMRGRVDAGAMTDSILPCH